MGDRTFSRTAYQGVHDSATRGGTRSATMGAEERYKKGEGIDPLVDPKGPPHLGPVRRSLPRFEKRGNLWVLTRGIPMAEETLLDTTGSMGNNVDMAFRVLPLSYEMLAGGDKPILDRYDPQIASAIFNDVEDYTGAGKAILCRTQFEMDEKIAVQMTLMVPGRGGCGNGKEDPQFGLFGAAYLTAAAINRYGLRYYHFTVSDEPVVMTVDLRWLKHIYGDDVIERLKENGFNFGSRNLPDTAQVVKDLQTRAHSFFLQVADRADVKDQWTELYGSDYTVMLPGGTEYLHGVKACIIGLTEGVLDLSSSVEFLRGHGIPAEAARQIVRAVSHIPIGAQAALPNFSKLPKAGDLFREKTDLWPIDSKELEAEADHGKGKPGKKKPGGVEWL